MAMPYPQSQAWKRAGAAVFLSAWTEKQAFNDRCCVPVGGSSRTEAFCHKLQQLGFEGSASRGLDKDRARTRWCVARGETAAALPSR
jgi:hypothetical protein